MPAPGDPSPLLTPLQTAYLEFNRNIRQFLRLRARWAAEILTMQAGEIADLDTMRGATTAYFQAAGRPTPPIPYPPTGLGP